MAAEAGFPWQASPSHPEKEGLVNPEIATVQKVIGSKLDAPSTPTVKFTNSHEPEHRKHSNSLHSLHSPIHFKNHRNSPKAVHRASQLSTISAAAATDAITPHKPTSPLPVRTIPGGF
jgi:hypothetical protein